MWAILLVAILVAWMLLKTRETFVIKVGNPFDNEDIISFDPDAQGSKIFSTWPHTCPEDRPVYEGGLCYVECEPGYHGNANVCWADTENRGIGMIPDRASCIDMGLKPADGWRESGILLCWKDLKCETSCDIPTGRLEIAGTCIIPGTRCSGPEARIKDPKCPGTWMQSAVGAFLDFGGNLAGNIAGDLAGGGASDTVREGAAGATRAASAGITDLIAGFSDYAEGLCYKPCPKEKPNFIDGMPYLCTRGELGLSYDRGAGTVPPLVRFGP